MKTFQVLTQILKVLSDIRAELRWWRKYETEIKPKASQDMQRIVSCRQSVEARGFWMDEDRK